MLKRYRENIEEETNQYTTNRYMNLKKSLLEFWNKQLESDLSLKNISFGVGTMGIIRNLCSFLIDKGDYVLGCTPQFPRFVSEVELRRANYEYYSFDKNNNYKFVATEFIKKMNNKYKMIHLENPNNPTGQIIDINDIEEIVQIAQQKDIVVLVDEAYGEYMDLKNSSISLVKKYDNLVVFRSASKFWGYPNERIGYIFSSEEIIKIYNMISLPFPFTTYSCNIFERTLKDYDIFKKTNKMVIDAKKEILKNLNEENYLYTDLGTPIFTIKSNKYGNLYEELLRNGIIAEPCTNYLNLDEKFARIRITKEYNKIIIDILKKIL